MASAAAVTTWPFCRNRLCSKVSWTPCSVAGTPTHHPRLGLVLSAVPITLVAQTCPVSLCRCGMGRSSSLLVVCATRGLCAKGCDASGWTRRGCAQKWHPGHPPHTQYCAPIPRLDPLSGGGASHHMPSPIRGFSIALNLKDECQGSQSPFLQRPSWPITDLLTTSHTPLSTVDEVGGETESLGKMKPRLQKDK